MFGKALLAAVMFFVCTAALSAADILRLDLNYYCRGHLRLVGEMPEGLKMSARKNYRKKKFADICYYTVSIDVDKVQEFEFTVEVAETQNFERVKLDPSLSPSKNLEVECLEFEAGDAKSSIVPCKISRWTSMLKGGVLVSKGKKITIKGKIRKIASPEQPAAEQPK